jgi:hypothetical protein
MRYWASSKVGSKTLSLGFDLSHLGREEVDASDDATDSRIRAPAPCGSASVDCACVCTRATLNRQIRRPRRAAKTLLGKRTERERRYLKGRERDAEDSQRA